MVNWGLLVEVAEGIGLATSEEPQLQDSAQPQRHPRWLLQQQTTHKYAYICITVLADVRLGSRSFDHVAHLWPQLRSW